MCRLCSDWADTANVQLVRGTGRIAGAAVGWSAACAGSSATTVSRLVCHWRVRWRARPGHSHSCQCRIHAGLVAAWLCRCESLSDSDSPAYGRLPRCGAQVFGAWGWCTPPTPGHASTGMLRKHVPRRQVSRREYQMGRECGVGFIWVLCAPNCHLCRALSALTIPCPRSWALAAGAGIGPATLLRGPL